MFISPINLNAHPLWPMSAALAAALLVASLLADPAILFLAPLAVPGVIWHCTRRNWLAADRSISRRLGPRHQRRRRNVGRSPPRAVKRRASGPAPSGQKRRQILVVRYRKELR